MHRRGSCFLYIVTKRQAKERPGGYHIRYLASIIVLQLSGAIPTLHSRDAPYPDDGHPRLLRRLRGNMKECTMPNAHNDDEDDSIEYLPSPGTA
jgi:hypothetical protein